MDWIDEFSAAWAREYPDTDTTTLSPMTRLVRLGVLMDTFQKETLVPFELTPSDYAVLSTLRSAGPPYQLSPSELYTALERSSGGMTKMLKRLEGVGLIERIPDPEDGRSTRVVLTEPGSRCKRKSSRCSSPAPGSSSIRFPRASSRKSTAPSGFYSTASRATSIGSRYFSPARYCGRLIT
jgi:DNA-binding MarR family transcriptional regulator